MAERPWSEVAVNYCLPTYDSTCVLQGSVL